MIPGREYLPVDETVRFSGLNVYDVSTVISGSQSPDLLNVEVVDNIIAKRPGYLELGVGGTPLAAGVPVIGLVEFENTSGTKFLIAITTKKQYYYNATSSQWVNITYQSGGVDVDWTGTEAD